MNRITPTEETDADMLLADTDVDTEFECADEAGDDAHLSLDTDEFDEQVQHAQEQLLALRHQQEMIERQKAEIEELKLRRQAFLRGRTEIAEKLNRSIITLERETYEAQKRVEQYLQVKSAFERHLENVEDLNPEEWSRSEMRNQLGRALSIIEDASTDYQKSIARVEALFADEKSSPEQSPKSGESSIISSAVSAMQETSDMNVRSSRLDTERDFGYWFRSGFAFTLPLIVFGVFALILHILLG